MRSARSEAVRSAYGIDVIKGEVGGHSAVGVLFGCTLLRRLPTRWVRRPAATLFIGFGLLALAQLVFNGDRLGLF